MRRQRVGLPLSGPVTCFAVDLAFIPSPEQSEWVLFGFIPIRAYALCLMAGIAAACWITEA
ncbi:MAG: prolipoprotein diacylglyceryl transferase, partial [Stackebrandtia sp.]